MLDYEIIPVTQFQQNCSLIWCDQTMEAAVVDPGGDIELIMDAVQRHQVELKKILLTHAHIDHAGATAEMSTTYQLPIEGPHKEDLFWIEALPQQSMMFGFPSVEGFVPTKWLEQGDQVTIGKETLAVRHTPGHTPGHVIFFHQQTKIAFVGDVLFQGSIGRTDFPKGDLNQLLSSIREQLWPLGEDVAFVPGHGPMSTFGEERRYNPFVAEER